jgi:hypothetical protein
MDSHNIDLDMARRRATSVEHWARIALGRRAEIAHCARIGTQRSLAHSTLGVLHVGDAERRKLKRLSGASFKFYQPPLVHLGWRFGLYRQTAQLYTLSFRVFGS